MSGTTQTINLPGGFTAAGIHCGVKSDANNRDLAVFVSDRPAVAAGVFTQNRVVGAPVTVSRERVPATNVRGVVINSGNANACTGERGLRDARTMTTAVAQQLQCADADVLLCSTGVIGRFLPIDKLEQGVVQACAERGDSPAHLEHAARAMMTTDTFPKLSTRTLDIGGKSVTISGVAKGAAMIAPNMATMLGVIMTDAALPVEQATSMLQQAVQRSFNAISVDGHTSTSDTVFLLANGAAEVTPKSDADVSAVQAALEEVAAELAMMIIRDAEGADHFITLDVSGLATEADAYRVAKTIAESALVKTAITGADPNWGRIISAAGYSGVAVEPERMRLSINGSEIFRDGSPTDADLNVVSNSIREARDVQITLDCGLGDAAVRFWTSDLTAEYVRLNSEYTT